eukprot:superscaffoldBa00002512_g14514
MKELVETIEIFFIIGSVDDLLRSVYKDLWAGFPQDYISLLHQWYCSLGQCCESGDCRITNNITGLSRDLQTKLHGQHLVQSVVLKAIQGFINNPESNKPLTLSFHGWSGTGKNFVARIISDNLYRDGVKSECVRLFIAPFHFPHARLVDTYKSELMSGHLIDFFVPFLPLEYRHVKLCARDAYAARGLETDEATLDEVAKAMLYVPKEERLFSAQGCKSIPQRINFFLP